MGGEARWEYFGEAEGRSRGGIRDEFGLTTGYNRKYAIRLLNGPPPSGGQRKRARIRKPRYGQAVISILPEVWKAAGYAWSVRLKALLPSWLPWIGQRYAMSQETEQQLLALSARQMDRGLASRKRERRRRI